MTGLVTLRKNCFLKHVIEGEIERRIEETGRRGRRRKQQLMSFRKRDGTANGKVGRLAKLV